MSTDDTDTYGGTHGVIAMAIAKNVQENEWTDVVNISNGRIKRLLQQQLVFKKKARYLVEAFLADFFAP